MKRVSIDVFIPELKADVDSLAPDGVHPSLEAHKALAREMYSKLHCGPSGDVKD